MPGIELFSRGWGHVGLERNSYTKKLEETFITGKPDSVTDGVSVKVNFYNASEKEIKYVTFEFVAYNAVGDVICDLCDKKLTYGKFTGPLAPNENASAVFENLWYSKTIANVYIHRVTVEYMDGTSETIADDNLVRIYDYSKPTKYSYEYNHNSVYYQKIGKAREEKEKIEEERKREAEAKRMAEQAKRAKKTKIIYGIIGVIVVAIMIFGVIVPSLG